MECVAVLVGTEASGPLVQLDPQVIMAFLELRARKEIQGAKGDRGVLGQEGLAGRQGRLGEDGETGHVGDPGAPGSQVIKEPKGPRGPQALEGQDSQVVVVPMAARGIKVVPAQRAFQDDLDLRVT
ncbi:unnamed protein product [Gadus morhua 'NCC']